eukprot:2028424-Pleurochrysis_carterae.AAC.2
MRERFRTWFCVSGMNAQGSALGVESERYFTTTLREQRAESCVSLGLRLRLRFCGHESSARVTVAGIVLRVSFVSFCLALRAIFVPVRAFAPSAGSPFVAPFLVRFWSRPLWISGSGAFFLAANGEGVKRVRVGHKLSAHVACLRVTEHAARGTYRYG